MAMFHYKITEQQLQQAVHKYIDGEYNAALISTSMNGIFEITSKEKNFILRFSHPLKEASQIYGEINFIKYLSERGFPVANPLCSKGNSYVEHLDTQEEFIVCAFEKARGKTVDFQEEKEWNGQMFRNWGKTMGKMHRITQSYIPDRKEYKRIEWNEECIGCDRSIFDPNLITPEGNEIVFKKWRELLHELSMLPKDKEGYGLVHGDLHSLNFYVNGDELTVFDFDDCCYHWFAYDIAIAFHDSLYGTPFGEREQRKEFIKYFSNCFFEGYNTENSLSKEWMERIPLFIKYREYLLYLVAVTHMNIADMEDEEKQMYSFIRYGLENDVPYVDF